MQLAVVNRYTLLPLKSKRSIQSASPTAIYGSRPAYLQLFLAYVLLIPAACAAQPALSPTQDQLSWLGQQIFRNECNYRPECLTAWNEGEDFPSLGIGHFIWYRAGQQEIYTESFPALLLYMQDSGIRLPDWIITEDLAQPWPTRADFLAAQDGDRMTELRTFLARHVDVQTAFIVSRFDLALERLLAVAPAMQQPIASRFTAVAQAQVPYGLYALIDYVHFKGEGINPAERYQGEGWGLLQVLQDMPTDSETPLASFVASARTVLARRVANAPAERREQRWLEGWNNRLATYLPTPANTAGQE